MDYEIFLSENACRFCLSDSGDESIDLRGKSIYICIDKKLVDLKKEVFSYLLLNRCESSNSSKIPYRLCCECKTIITEYYSLKKSFHENQRILGINQLKINDAYDQIIEFCNKYDFIESLNITQCDEKIIIEKKLKESSYDNLKKETESTEEYCESNENIEDFTEQLEEHENDYIEKETDDENTFEDNITVEKSISATNLEKEETKNMEIAKSRFDSHQKDHVLQENVKFSIEILENDAIVEENKNQTKTFTRKRKYGFEKVPECEISTKILQDEKFYAVTRTSISEQVTFECSNCQSVFLTEKAANDHVLKYGSQKFCTERFCNKCSIVFASEKMFKKHLHYHVLERISNLFKYHECIFCNIVFGTEKDFEKHMKNHIENDNYQYEFQGSTQLENCEILRKDLTEMDSSVWKCGHCNKFCNDKTQLNFHVTIFHANIFCPFENQQFGKSVSYLLDHIKTKHPDQLAKEDIVFNCSFCNHEFSSKNALCQHTKTCNNKPFQCDHCNHKFGLRRQLEEHLQSITGYAKFCCSYCNKTFTNKAGLTVHLRIHTNEKKYKCLVCEKKFRTNSHRSAHMDSHNNTKKFQCQYCKEMFQTRGAKRAHESSHNSAHICLLCQKLFKQRSHIIRHINTVHKIKCTHSNMEKEVQKLLSL